MYPLVVDHLPTVEKALFMVHTILALLLMVTRRIALIATTVVVVVVRPEAVAMTVLSIANVHHRDKGDSRAHLRMHMVSLAISNGIKACHATISGY